MHLILDTNVFNLLLDDQLQLTDLPQEGIFVATHVQLDELGATKSKQRREQLLAKFEEVGPEMVATESGVWGTSNWGGAKWGDGTLFAQLRDALDAKNGAKRNNAQDALIAEVALKNGYTLVTADGDLSTVAASYGVPVRFLA